jgi:hypothetical protein
MTGRPGMRGCQVWKHPLDPTAMARACLKLASDLRAEDAAAWPGLMLIGLRRVTRAEAARRMDEQAERWAIEAAGGARNVRDRALIGVP